MLCSVIFGGCIARHIGLQPLPKLDNPRGYLLEILIASAEPSDLSGILQMKISSPRASVNSKNAFFLKKPASLRLETLGFLSHPTMISLTDGETIGIYVIPDMKYYSGIASPENIFKILGISISVQDMLHILLGSPPLPNLDNIPLVCQQDHNTYHFKIGDGNSLHHLWIDPFLRRIVKYCSTDATSIITEITYDDFKPVANYLVPLKILFNHYPSATKLQLSYDALSATSIAAEGFLFILPSAARALSLDDFPSAW